MSNQYGSHGRWELDAAAVGAIVRPHSIYLSPSSSAAAVSISNVCISQCCGWSPHRCVARQPIEVGGSIVSSLEHTPAAQIIRRVRNNDDLSRRGECISFGLPSYMRRGRKTSHWMRRDPRHFHSTAAGDERKFVHQR